MILPDVNVVIQAYKVDAVNHAGCRQWLESVVADDAVFGMSPQVLSSAARILTNRRAWPRPHSISDVLDFCNKLLEQPNCHIVLPGPRHWQIFCDLCVQAGATGDFVAHAWYAALAIEHGCEWITLDRDFARFERLRWRTPF